jgi:hypothetical protein
MGNHMAFPALTAIGNDDRDSLEAVFKNAGWSECKGFLHEGMEISEWKEMWKSQNFHFDKYQNYSLCSCVVAEQNRTCTVPGLIIISPTFEHTFRVKDPGLAWLANIKIEQGDTVLQLIAKHHQKLHPAAPLRNHRQQLTSKCGRYFEFLLEMEAEMEGDLSQVQRQQSQMQKDYLQGCVDPSMERVVSYQRR